jgi:hypothetical protein
MFYENKDFILQYTASVTGVGLQAKEVVLLLGRWYLMFGTWGYRGFMKMRISFLGLGRKSLAFYIKVNGAGFWDYRVYSSWRIGMPLWQN